MPLQYDDEPGSWGRQSEGWPETPYTMGKWLLCTKTKIVPYGSYVVVGVERVEHPNAHRWEPSYHYDYSKAFIRVETYELKKRLEDAYQGLFVECRRLLLKEEFGIEDLTSGWEGKSLKTRGDRIC